MPALPLAFQLTFDGETAADSQATPPRLKIFGPLDDDGPCQADTSVEPLLTTDPDDSLWQYFDASCLPVGTTACPRDAFTHQYNLQTTDLPDDDKRECPLEP